MADELPIKPITSSNVQKRMLELLSDGLPHSRSELHTCLWDEQGGIENIRTHIMFLRRILRSYGEDIICENRSRKTFYRHVRLLHSSHDGL